MENVAVVNDGKLLGYLIRDVYVPVACFRFIFCESIGTVEIVFGIEMDNAVFIEGKRYENVFEVGVPRVPHREFLFKPVRAGVGCFEYSIMRGSCEVATLLLTSDLYSSSSIDITLLEVKQKNQGIGGAIVRQLHSYGIDITGLAVSRARNFWLKMGAEFGKNDRFIIRR